MQNRKALIDGGWFDESGAESWAESTYHDGRNHVSRATGDQWLHEHLYRSRNGQWIINSYSDWQGSTETYERVTPSDAAAWFIRNLQDAPEALKELVDTMEA